MKKIFGYINALYLYAVKYYYTFKHKGLQVEGKIILGKRVKLVLGKGAVLTAKGNLTLQDDVHIRVRAGAEVRFGKDCYLNRSSTVNAHKSIIFGDGVMLGENVKIYDNDHTITGNHIERRLFNVSPVEIRDGSWIANSAVILKGSVMGPNTVVGALTLVSGTLDANALYLGVPARRMKKLEPEEKQEQ